MSTCTLLCVVVHSHEASTRSIFYCYLPFTCLHSTGPDKGIFIFIIIIFWWFWHLKVMLRLVVTNMNHELGNCSVKAGDCLMQLCVVWLPGKATVKLSLIVARKRHIRTYLCTVKRSVVSTARRKILFVTNPRVVEIDTDDRFEYLVLFSSNLAQRYGHKMTFFAAKNPNPDFNSFLFRFDKKIIKCQLDYWNLCFLDFFALSVICVTYPETKPQFLYQLTQKEYAVFHTAEIHTFFPHSTFPGTT